MAHIQIDDVTPETSYAVGTASTGPFTIPWAFFQVDGSDIDVYVDTVLQDPEDYTITPTAGFTGGYPGGTLTFDATISNCTLRIVRNVPLERTSDFPSSGPLNVTALNTELDKHIAMMQQGQALFDRSLKVSPGETIEDIDLTALDGKALIVSGNAITGQSIADPLATPDQVIDYIHVQDFGAVGDGVTDDTTAINLALSYIRTQTADTQNARKVFLTGGAFLYRVDGSLNGTGITSGLNWGIKNLLIDAHCAGKVVLDLTDSRFGVLENVHIWGDETDQPYTGIQQSRQTSGAAAGSFHFTNVNVLGYFTNACLHNYASEVCHYDQCKFWNYRDLDVDGEAWAAIFDGQGVKTVISDFVTVATGLKAFNLTTCTSCEFRKLTSDGSTVFLSRYVGFHAEGCYAVCDDTAHISIYSSGVERNFYWNGHFEGVAPTGIIRFVGPAGNNSCYGLTLIDHSAHVFDQIIESDPSVTRTTIYDLNLYLPNLDNDPLSNGIFDDASLYQLLGAKIVAPVGNMNLLDDFAGTGFVGEYRDITGTSIYQRGRVNYSDSPAATVGPNHILYRNSASPAASDLMGQLIFRGKDSAANDADYANLISQIVTATDGSEEGRLLWKLLIAGATTEIMRIDSGGLSMFGANPVIDANRHFRPKSYSVVGLGSVSASPAGMVVYVTNGASNKHIAVSDGTIWRYTDGSAV